MNWVLSKSHMTSLLLNPLNPSQSSCLTPGQHLTLSVLLTACCTFRFCEIYLPSDFFCLCRHGKLSLSPSFSFSSQGSLLGPLSPAVHGSWTTESIPMTSSTVTSKPHLCPDSPNVSATTHQVLAWTSQRGQKSRTTHYPSCATTKTYPLPHVMTQ